MQPAKLVPVLVRVGAPWAARTRPCLLSSRLQAEGLAPQTLHVANLAACALSVEQIDHVSQARGLILTSQHALPALNTIGHQLPPRLEKVFCVGTRAQASLPQQLQALCRTAPTAAELEQVVAHHWPYSLKAQQTPHLIYLSAKKVSHNFHGLRTAVGTSFSRIPVYETHSASLQQAQFAQQFHSLFSSDADGKRHRRLWFLYSLDCSKRLVDLLQQRADFAAILRQDAFISMGRPSFAYVKNQGATWVLQASDPSPQGLWDIFTKRICGDSPFFPYLTGKAFD